MFEVAAAAVGVLVARSVWLAANKALPGGAWSYIELVVSGRAASEKRSLSETARSVLPRKSVSATGAATESCLMLEILVIGLEAGLNIDNCVRTFAFHGSGVLAAEMREMLEAVEVGKSRQDVLDKVLQAGTQGPLRTILVSLYQAERSGSGVVDTAVGLLGQARRAARNQARKQVLKAPIKMLFPLVGLILPSLMLILLAPAVLGVLRP